MAAGKQLPWEWDAGGELAAAWEDLRDFDGICWFLRLCISASLRVIWIWKVESEEKTGRQAGKEPDFAGVICFRRGTALFWWDDRRKKSEGRISGWLIGPFNWLWPKALGKFCGRSAGFMRSAVEFSCLLLQIWAFFDSRRRFQPFSTGEFDVFIHSAVVKHCNLRQKEKFWVIWP